MSVGVEGSSHDEAPPFGAQSVQFYEGYDPRFDGSGLPTVDGPSVAQLLAGYLRAIGEDYGDHPDTATTILLEELHRRRGNAGLTSDDN